MRTFSVCWSLTAESIRLCPAFPLWARFDSEWDVLRFSDCSNLRDFLCHSRKKTPKIDVFGEPRNRNDGCAVGHSVLIIPLKTGRGGCARWWFAPKTALAVLLTSQKWRNSVWLRLGVSEAKSNLSTSAGPQSKLNMIQVEKPRGLTGFAGQGNDYSLCFFIRRTYLTLCVRVCPIFVRRSLCPPSTKPSSLENFAVFVVSRTGLDDVWTKWFWRRNSDSNRFSSS